MVALGAAVASSAGSTNPANAKSRSGAVSESKSFASEGHSISVSWAGNYTGVYANSRPGVRHCALASGGGIEQIALRVDKVLDCKPNVLTVLVGAHGLGGGPTPVADFLGKLFAYSDGLRAKEIKVAVATVLPEYHADNPAYDRTFNARRVEVNEGIRAGVGRHIDAVIDFAADPVMGPNSAAQDKSLYQDGTHPTYACGFGCGGQGKLAAIYAPVMDQLLGIR